MSQQVCDVEDCDRPVADAWCCMGCGHRLEKALRKGEWLGEQLNTVLTRQARYEEHSGKTNGTKITPLYFNYEASEAAYVLRNTLTTWVRLIAEERGRDLPAGTIAGMSAWLLGHVEWLRHHRAGHEALEEIPAAIGDATRTIDRPNNRTTFAIGPCPELGCSGEIRVFIPAREDKPALMVCNDCEARWGSVQFLNIGKRIHASEVQRIAPYVDSAAAASALGVTIRTVQRWIIDGSLTNFGSASRIMLDLSEIEAIRTRREAEVSA